MRPVNAIILPFWLSHLRKPLCSQAVIRNYRYYRFLTRYSWKLKTCAEFECDMHESVVEDMHKFLTRYLGHSKACVITKS